MSVIEARDRAGNIFATCTVADDLAEDVAAEWMRDLPELRIRIRRVS